MKYILYKIISLLAVPILLIIFAPTSSFANDSKLLFSRQETQSDMLKPFTKWLEMLERYSDEADIVNPQTNCVVSTNNNCVMSEWNNYLSSITKLDFYEKLIAVNNFLNEKPYIVDPVNWGLKDYWATPAQFSVKDGDCEDYAIAKYISLKKLGIPADNLRIVILNDKNLGVVHAVLAVYDTGNIYILDNQTSQVVQDKEIYHYQPIYSINESHWWRHF